MGIASGQLKQLSPILIGSNPTVNEDDTKGYMVGSVVWSISGMAYYYCTDATAGAAVWTLYSSGGGGIPIAAAGGTVDAITATYTPALTLSDQVTCMFVASGANTSTTPTFSPDGLTAHTIVKWGGQALLPGDIPDALFVGILEYNLANTRWELLNPAGFQDWVDWSASDNIVGGTVITNNFRYRIAGYKQIECVVNIRVTSTGATFTFDLPVAAANTHTQFCVGRILNNGASEIGYLQTTAGSVTVAVKRSTGSDPTNASTKEYSQNFFIHTV